MPLSFYHDFRFFFGGSLLSFQETREKVYSIGGKVEIAYIREKLPVAWYMATVIKVIDESILLIEYESFKNKDGTLLSEVVSTQYIRPHPPPTLEARNFDLLDEVEAYYNGGWWPGVVAKVNTGLRYNVKFMQWEEEIEFHHTELRFLYDWDWVDGQWIQASQVGIAFTFLFFFSLPLLIRDELQS